MCYLFFLIGAIFGSFMNVLIYRLPRGISIITPKSNCPNCKQEIRCYDNIPLISYILLKGRCRGCGVRIPIRYFIVELVTSLVFFLLCIKYGLSLNSLALLIFSFFILTAGFTDLYTAFEKDQFECGVIPSVILYAGIILGLILSFFNGFGIVNSILGGVIGFISLFIPAIVYKILKGREGMGDGDMYLMAMSGTFLGVKAILPILILSSFVGAVIGIVIIKVLKDNSFPIPFGPFIALGSIVYLFYGEELINLYIGLLR
ncbi:prepilin peptidase [Calditerrivibrio nitroreducens]|uniref:Prepilin leader peptidase/N-methyltransferase n=1 Tax=Calditerrivibrio nitroreducens (strain DSM 19672 / NBRC 101217 / Yu37-1) TaxID=768670 RepID=E4TJX0_CALNY|nr:A24 family peptidase [Calditerrivibrio nitroreducens]ADR18221.1 Prepilin peptidase [Calditerrivibrio nitroreducens DSM 19672]